MSVRLDVSDYREALQEAKLRALTAIGATAEGHAKRACPVDTGRLRASITYAVNDDTVYVGTNVDYAEYIEYGTGAANYPGGTDKDKWVYCDALGHFHTAHPQRPRPYIKPAIADHLSEYRDYIERELTK